MKTNWLKIAEAYETEPEKRTDEQKEIASWGLCYAIEVVFPDWDDWHKAKDILREVRAKFAETVPLLPGYWFPFGRQNDLKRAKVAQYIAENYESL